MTTRVKTIEAAQPSKLDALIEAFINNPDSNPSLKTAQKENTLKITVSHSETIGGYNRPEPRYMAVITWPDIM